MRGIDAGEAGLSQGARDAIDLALLDICLADWEAGNLPGRRELRLMRAAYLQGRVDQEYGRPLAPIQPRTERSK